VNAIANGLASNRSRIPQLDVLRGIAILLVLGHHTSAEWQQCGILGFLAYFFRWLGWSGVDLFFVLSGFLIGGLLFGEISKTGRLHVSRFIVRRAFKIWPAYFVFVAFSLVKLAHHGQSPKAAIDELWPNFLHIQNYVTTVIGHTWSLAVEEHFYLLLPLFLMFCLSRSRARRSLIHLIPYLAVFLMLVCFSIRCLRQFVLHQEILASFATDGRMDGLFFGVLLAYFHAFRPDMKALIAKWKYPLLVFGVLLPATNLVFTSIAFKHSLGFTLNYLGYGAMLAGLMSFTPNVGIIGKAIVSLPARILAFIGVFSYSIYLWHIDLAAHPVDHWFRTHGMDLTTAPQYAALLLADIAVAVGAGALLAILIEKPALWVRDRWWPAAQQPRPAADRFPALVQEPLTLSATPS
jgi:peptidoglycan/LPS O-acetylase OafA/YrhL